MSKSLNFELSEKAFHRYEREKVTRGLTWSEYFEEKSKELVEGY